MALVDHNGQTVFPAAESKVFEALCTAIPAIDGLSIESADEPAGRIVVAGMNPGAGSEGMLICLKGIEGDRTNASIGSYPETGPVEDLLRKNRENLEHLFNATYAMLGIGG